MIHTVVSTQNHAKMAKPNEPWYGTSAVGLNAVGASSGPDSGLYAKLEVGTGDRGVGKAVGTGAGAEVGRGEGSEEGFGEELGKAVGLGVGFEVGCRVVEG
eukprot:CAMPEP_0171918272 /NCGR_PEP_ID=MMETSP0993-20121228/16954_1 /TAXON_ID=483369 /ORGANISM="non described non described, Strain CCMP2098" /LENGTH=100 /DNA_ID=CAMNT_0012554505 /DNA_START=53 /DNA_END=351 /DNA_ORIENTATION=+